MMRQIPALLLLFQHPWKTEVQFGPISGVSAAYEHSTILQNMHELNPLQVTFNTVKFLLSIIAFFPCIHR